MYHERKFYCPYSFTVILHEKIEKTWNDVLSFEATFPRISNFKISQVCVYRCIEQLFDQTSRKSWKRNRERKKCHKLDFLGNETSYETDNFTLCISVLFFLYIFT